MVYTQNKSYPKKNPGKWWYKPSPWAGDGFMIGFTTLGCRAVRFLWDTEVIAAVTLQSLIPSGLIQRTTISHPEFC